MTTKVAINGLGRIGRAFLKVAITNPDIKIVAANDLGDLENLAYLLRYDSAYGKSGLDVKTDNGSLVVNGQSIKFIQEKDPAKLPWAELGVDVVVESTGFFESYDKAKLHIDAGARKVVVSAPIKGEPVPGITGGTVLMGINDEMLATCQISSNASCTTNSASPLIKILHDTIGIDKAVLNTIHAYTASQKLVDSPDAGDFRRGRAAAQNIVPSTTGAAIAVTKVIPELAGKFDGIALRVPVITGSLVDVTFIAKRNTTVEEVNEILKEGAANPRWSKVFAVTEEPLVSSDIIGESHASLADLAFTKVVGGNLVKVLAWYDNEMGYTHTLVDHVIKTGGV
ncbi:MAG: type I glyceraldehyde-3-phosphate dehydrogenase [Candidatus Vogelbacteria bacterium]|nr:type I glyceraldehyde-3-phosphate dehydrogenase [Candidatus Vogelbacteria bacterium]